MEADSNLVCCVGEGAGGEKGEVEVSHKGCW